MQLSENIKVIYISCNQKICLLKKNYSFSLLKPWPSNVELELKMLAFYAGKPKTQGKTSREREQP